jgi:cytosine/adenosine deaminase-related metal-dependent hydrolase
MKYRKFRAANLFTGFEILGNDHVLISDTSGIVQDIIPETDAGDDVQTLKGILSPGFINCHCHLELSHMKNKIPEKTRLVDFVYKIVTERQHHDEEIADAIDKAEIEMQENGIVAVGDICNNNSSLAQKRKSGLHYYNFIEASGWDPEVAQARFKKSLELYEQFRAMNPESGISIVPHAPYSVSDNLWKQIQSYFEQKVVTIHNQETVFEDEFFLHGTGDLLRMFKLMQIDNSHHKPTKKTSLQTYFSKIEQAQRILLVHNTFTQQSDIDFIKMTDHYKHQTIFFCLCANANFYIENALPPVEMLKKNNCNIVLGTDSLASNRSLSILNEMKTILQNFPSISLKEVLKWATINGAKALEMENKLGSFEKGKQPGIVLIEKNLSSSKRIL